MEAWAYLNRVVEGPSRPLQEFLAAGKSAEELADGIRRRASWLGELGRQTQARYEWDRAVEDLAIAADHGARLIVPGMDEWPTASLDQAFGFAASGTSEHVRSYQDDAVAPHGLWIRGGNLGAAVAQSVSVVGTRAHTRYGHDATAELVKDLAAHHWTVVSGGALGIDTAAHTAALRSDGPTVAVMACGIDRAYPARNAGLFDDIVAAGGCVVTEYPPGVPPQRHRFLTRNRLVAALTAGTVVVEAGWRSGALNTLSWAEGLGKVTMAVPGPITSTGSLGCHQRIKTGTSLVTSGADIRELVGAVGEVDASYQHELDFGPSPVQQLSRNELRVFDALPAAGTDAGAESAAVASAAGLTVPLTVHLLVDLDKRGIVRREGVEWFRALD